MPGCFAAWLSNSPLHQEEPVFLAREQIDEIHRDQINEFGGLHGLRDEGALESAIAQPINVYLYGDGDLCEIARVCFSHRREPSLLRRKQADGSSGRVRFSGNQRSRN